MLIKQIVCKTPDSTFALCFTGMQTTSIILANLAYIDSSVRCCHTHVMMRRIPLPSRVETTIALCSWNPNFVVAILELEGWVVSCKSIKSALPSKH